MRRGDENNESQRQKWRWRYGDTVLLCGSGRVVVIEFVCLQSEATKKSPCCMEL
jgi:hypothetical protein